MRALVASALVAAAPLPLAAQEASCLASVPRSALRPTVAHLVADDLGEGAAPIPALARGLVRDVADAAGRQLRLLLGGSRNALPARDTSLAWCAFMGHVHVVVRRDGSYAWSYPWGAPGHRAAADSAGEHGVLLVGHAVDALHAGTKALAWPDGVTGVDSIAFRLRFVWPDPRVDGSMGEMPVADATPVLRLDVPAFTPMRIVKRAVVAYPEMARQAEMRTTVTMRFQLDTLGRVVEESIQDVWPDGRQRPSGKLADYYADFVQAVRRGIVGSTYEPARFGGCRVPQLVEQDFTFGMKGRVWNDTQ